MRRGAGIALGMDGKGAWRHDVSIERLWRSIGSEKIDLWASDAVGEAQASTGRDLSLQNGRRPHTRLDWRMPDQADLGRLSQTAAA